MWPVMTLTLLLQLTDDEQLYAAAPMPEQPAQEVTAPVETEEETTAAAWPEEA